MIEIIALLIYFVIQNIYILEYCQLLFACISILIIFVAQLLS